MIWGVVRTKKNPSFLYKKQPGPHQKTHPQPYQRFHQRSLGGYFGEIWFFLVCFAGLYGKGEVLARRAFFFF